MVGRRGILHRHLLKGPRLRRHRRLTELVGVHLAQALEALKLGALLRHLQHATAQLLEGQRLRLVVAEADLEGRRAGQLDQLAVDPQELQVVVGFEQRARDAVRLRQPRLALNGADDELRRGALENP